MIVTDAAPSTVLDAHHRSDAGRRERLLDERLLVRREAHDAPHERDPPRQLPLDDAPDLERALARHELDRLEQPPAELRLEHDPAGTGARNTELPSMPPPEIDL